ncbi:putative branched-chain amino acid aminotransferase [Xylariaceae sp. FL1651]|nr:putative branched-chain amino acid aminotransferase [Xylariaceae sp. FL1651]
MTVSSKRSIPPPNPQYKWGVYDSKKNNVAGHVRCIFTPQDGWSQPEFVESPFLSVHGLAPGLHYGQQVYEGLQARRTVKNDVLIFRPASNASRIANSAIAVSMPPVSEQLFLDCIHMAVARNAEYVPPADFSGSLYIRPVQFGSGCQIGLEPPDEFIFAVFVQPHIAFHGHGALRALVAEDFDRAATRGTGNVKVGGNYAPVIRWSREAKKDANGGWGVLLHVDSKTQTYIDEFSTSGFIGIQGPRQGTTEESSGCPTIVIADSPAAIKSITSSSVAELARSFGWTVEKRQVKLDELSSFTEVLAVGTAAGLVPVTVIRHNSRDATLKFLADGPCYQKLRDTLKGIQCGSIEDTFGWCESLRYDEFA